MSRPAHPGVGGSVAGERGLVDIIPFAARISLFSANTPPTAAAGFSLRFASSMRRVDPQPPHSSTGGRFPGRAA